MRSAEGSDGAFSRIVRSSPPPRMATTRSAAVSPLLSLPRDVLAIVVAMSESNSSSSFKTKDWSMYFFATLVEGDEKKHLRLACAQLRDLVDSAVTSLRRHTNRREGLFLTSQLIMRLPRLMEVNIWSMKGITNLAPLAACMTLQYLDCSYTAINSLEPLATCLSLHTLKCYKTAVSSLAPLADCKSLHTLHCDNSSIRSLEPLARCKSLHTLFCFGTAVSSLAPLAACKLLHTLHCHSTAVSSLEPLAACTALLDLCCCNTPISSLAPLATCTALKKLVCDSRLSTDFDFMKNAKIERNFIWSFAQLVAMPDY